MVEARGISKRFGRLQVLDGIDLTIPRGRVSAIIGPNAAGKTTFNKILLGLVRADAGTIRLDGEIIGATAAYRERIGYMPQAARFPENLSARDIFSLVRELRRPDAQRDEELIEAFDLQRIMEAPMRVLSGGTRQRVNAALAFLFRPDLLILDEPTAGLDPVSSSALKDKIRRDRAAGRTFILTSHVLSELEELADHIVFLLDGRVRFAGSPDEFMTMTGQGTLERSVAIAMKDRRQSLRIV